MTSHRRVLSCFAIALMLLAGPLLAETSKPAASDKSKATPNTFGREVGDLFTFKELDTRPVLVAGSRPQYPRELRKAGTPGYVIVEFIINPQGDVIQMQVLESSHPAFEMPALKAVQTWKFEPGKKGKRAVNVHAFERLEFEAPKK